MCEQRRRINIPPEVQERIRAELQAQRTQAAEEALQAEVEAARAQARAISEAVELLTAAGYLVAAPDSRAALALLKDFGRASKGLEKARGLEAFDEAAAEYRRLLGEVKEMAEGLEVV